ncbi:MAG TPA: hypothetical protein ENK27_00345 [Desulfobulbus sp.]|nr:hypothetical protein [Desulfobulbus sp.]
MKTTRTEKIALLLVIFLALLAGTSRALTRSEVEKNLTCYVCTGEALNIDRCSGGDRMRAEIDRRLARGQDLQTILDFFVSQFGEDILTVPPRRGFNLVAWAAPFVMLLIGLVVAFVVIRRWNITGRRRTAQRTAGEPAPDPARRRQVEEELQQLEDEP